MPNEFDEFDWDEYDKYDPGGSWDLRGNIDPGFEWKYPKGQYSDDYIRQKQKEWEAFKEKHKGPFDSEPAVFWPGIHDVPYSEKQRIFGKDAYPEPKEGFELLFKDRIKHPERYPKLKEGDYDVTHKMAWGQVDDKYIAFPTVVYEGGKLVDLVKEGRDPIEYAINYRGFKEFETAEEAERYTKTYKRGTPLEGRGPVPSTMLDFPANEQFAPEAIATEKTAGVVSPQQAIGLAEKMKHTPAFAPAFAAAEMLKELGVEAMDDWKGMMALMDNPHLAVTNPELASVLATKFMRNIDMPAVAAGKAPVNALSSFGGAGLANLTNKELGNLAAAKIAWKAFRKKHPGKINKRKYVELMDKVRQKTGWYRGMDGKWQIEIDNSKMRVHAWPSTHGETYGRYYDDVLSYNEAVPFGKMAGFQTTNAQGVHGVMAVKGVNKLENVIKDPELFEKYPILKTMRVQLTEAPSGQRSVTGHFDVDKRGFYISLNLPKDMYDFSSKGQLSDFMDAATHEIDHAIGYLEDFSPGWNSKSAPMTKRQQRIYTDYFEGLISADPMMDPKVASEKAKIEVYKRTRGEWGARVSSLRRTMTPEQRKKSPFMDEFQLTEADTHAVPPGLRRKKKYAEHKKRMLEEHKHEEQFLVEGFERQQALKKKKKDWTKNLPEDFWIRGGT